MGVPRSSILTYWAFGLAITPLEPYNNELCAKRFRGKKPINNEWQKTVWTRNRPMEKNFFEPHSGLRCEAGWVLGPEHVVIDVDPRNFSEDVDSLAMLSADCGFDLLEAAGSNVVKTGGGGFHLYFFKSPEILLCHTHLKYPGIEMKTCGRQVVICGSMHASGNEYVPYKGALDLERLSPLPGTVAEIMKPHSEAIISDGTVVSGVNDGDVQMIHKAAGLISAAAACSAGGRSNMMYALACRVKDLGLSRELCLSLIKPYNNRCLPPLADRELYETVWHAYRYGKRKQGEMAPNAVFGDLPPADFVDPFDIGEDIDNSDLVDWRNDLIKTAKGSLKANSTWNVNQMLRNLPELSGIFGKNLFINGVFLVGSPPWAELDKRAFKMWKPIAEKEVDDNDILRLKNYLTGSENYESNILALNEAVNQAADAKQYHPVAAYLDGLKWDGTPRLSSWLIDYLGAEDTPYVRAVGRKTLLAAVMRILAPGTKFDQLLILEGTQGIGKSTAVRILAGEKWFTDALPSILGKDVIDQIRGKWIIEVGEMDAASRAEISALKAFLSRQTDRARLAYERRAVDFPRQCIFIGTTNSSVYLKDETGNRRFWPVEVRKVDTAKLLQDRDQLWAEAYHAATEYGEALYLEKEDIAAEAKVQQSKREFHDEWGDVILKWVFEEKLDRVRGVEIWEKCFGRGAANYTRTDQLRMANVMKRIGWTGKTYRDSENKLVFGYVNEMEEVFT